MPKIGKVALLCGGKLVAAPEAGAFYTAICLIAIPTIFYGAFTYARALAHRVFALSALLLVCYAFIVNYIIKISTLHDINRYSILLIAKEPLRNILLYRSELPSFASIPILIGSFWLLGLSLGSLITCRLTDPGILPPRNQPHHFHPPTDPLSEESYTNSTGSRETDAHNGEKLAWRWCRTCHIWRPPRASHCSTCNTCVENFDHHCPWVGNCVGKRNYRYFFTFVWSTIFYAAFTFSACVVDIVYAARENPTFNFLDGVAKSPSSAVLCFYTFLIALSLCGLGGYHTTLVASGLTTNEEMKRRYRVYGNPFAESCGKNFARVLYGPFYPSAIHPDWASNNKTLFSPSLSSLSSNQSDVESGLGTQSSSESEHDQLIGDRNILP